MLQHTFGSLALLVALVLPTEAGAISIMFDWTSPTQGTAGGIDATVNATINAGSMLTSTASFTDPTYQGEFASFHALLNYRSPSGPAVILSTITFSSALPVGSRLILYDLDHLQETATLTSSGLPLTLLAQLESMAGANSIFPSWNPLTGELMDVSGAQLNSAEASVFDLGGLSSIGVDVQGGGNSSTVALAVALPIPEPSTLALTSLGIGWLALRRRRR